MARFARAPSRPSAVLPRSAAAPRGRSPLGGHRPCPFRCRSTGETSDWPLWISPPACWGSGTKCRGGAVRRTAGKLQGVSWLASLAPPPGLRPYSPLSLPLHGGEVLWEVIVRARFAAAPTGEKPLSRPFCCRFAREKSCRPVCTCACKFVCFGYGQHQCADRSVDP